MNRRRLGSLVGIPIYTLDEGKKIGNVKDVIYDGDEDQLIAFTVEEPGLFSSRRWVLTFERVKSLGEDAVMIENTGVFLRPRQVPIVDRALKQRNGAMTGKVLLTESGTNLGSISDVIIDEATGHAVTYEVSGGIAKDIGTGRNYINAPQSAHVGTDSVIVPDETEGTLSQQEPGGILGTYESAKGRVSDYTQEQEIKMSLGKTAGRDVRDDAEYLIVAKGEYITQQVIDEAVSKGKMHEVALAAGVGSAQQVGGATRERTGPKVDESKGRLAEAWSGFTDATHEFMDKSGRARAVAAHKNFLKGKVSATTVRDNLGKIIISEGDVISPLPLDTLDRMGMLDQVRVKATIAEHQQKGEPQVHLVLESFAEHEQHKTSI